MVEVGMQLHRDRKWWRRLLRDVAFLYNGRFDQ
jgi:hypothetical protein